MPRPHDSRPGLLSDYRKLAGTPWARLLCLIVFFEGAVFFGGFTYVAADLHARFGLSFSAIGIVVASFGVGSVLFALSVYLLIARLGERGLVLGGGCVVATGYVILAVTPVWQSAPLAVAALGFGYYMLHNTLQTNATQMLPEARGTAVAGFSSALFVGQSVGVAIAAPIVDRAGAAPVFVIAAALWILLALWIARSLSRR